MRGTVPTLHCDDDSGCEAWAHDLYEMTVSSVDGVRVTATERAPGWRSDALYDYCPAHRERSET